MKIILPYYNIEIVIKNGSGSITSTLRETWDYGDDEDEKENVEKFNIMMDGIESLILAQACAGIDVTSEAYIESLKTAVEACANNS